MPTDLDRSNILIIKRIINRSNLNEMGEATLLVTGRSKFGNCRPRQEQSGCKSFFSSRSGERGGNGEKT